MSQPTSRPGDPDFHLLPGSRELVDTVQLADDLPDRRRAAVALGEALRALTDAAVRTEVPTEVLWRTAEALRALEPPLTARLRTREQIPLTDDLVDGVRMYSPAVGPGNPVAPPMTVEYVDGGVVGTCTLGLAYEGPPMFGHGGVSALLLDQILGHAVAAIRAPGMTVELTTKYRRPVPLETPLRLWATATVDDSMVIRARGELCRADAPEDPLVLATARFVTLRPEQALRIFAAAKRPERIEPEAAHD
ncbi:MAG TPA: PaaI family thioesterase [Pseudonocardiaceae bacterium]